MTYQPTGLRIPPDKKKRNRVIFIVGMILLVLISLFFWMICGSYLERKYLLEHGVEVTATLDNIAEQTYTETTGDITQEHIYGYMTYYVYRNAAGRKYTGPVHMYGTYEEAESHLGEEIQILINVHNTSSMPLGYENIDGRLYFILAIVTTSVVVVYVVLGIVFRKRIFKK